MSIDDFIGKFSEAVLDNEIENLSPDTELHDIDDWSSLSVMLVIAFFKDEFKIQLGESDVQAAVTIQDLFNLL